MTNATPTPVPAGNSYDEVPYESHPYAQTHPSRLAVVATLFGMTPPPVENCRVLELGCASGGNLIPMAESLPGSSFVGVDLSGRQVAEGQRVVQETGLKNVRLHHTDILAIDESWGAFDYVIAHGVFSWVPDTVQAKILDICNKQLTPSGVVYISYNTYPGWHMRGMIRDMMRFHAARFDRPDKRVWEARALLDFLAQSAPQDGGPYSTLLRLELESLRQQADHYLFHEHLEEVNAPLYFHQFMELAGKHGLRYLGESRITTMVMGNFTPDVQKALLAIASDQIQAEQYMDFVRNRTFRETLLVRAEAKADWSILPESLRSLHLTTPQRVNDAGIDVRGNATVQYTTRSGMTLSTTSNLLKAAMRVLRERWPATISFSELEAAVNNLLGRTSSSPDALAVALLNTFLSSDLLDLHAVPIGYTGVGAKPRALASARARLNAGELGVANRRHESVRPPDLERRLLPLLDGTRDREAIIEGLVELVLSGNLGVEKAGQPLTEPAAIRQALGPSVEKALNWIASTSLLVD